MPPSAVPPVLLASSLTPAAPLLLAHPPQGGCARLAQLRPLRSRRLAGPVASVGVLWLRVGAATVTAVAAGGRTHWLRTLGLRLIDRSGRRHRPRRLGHDARHLRAARRGCRGHGRLGADRLGGLALAGDDVVLREGGHVAHLLLDPLAAAAIGRLALLPVREDRRGDEDR